MGTTRPQLEIHTCERDSRSCSNSMSTITTQNGTWNLQTAQQQVCRTTWVRKVHRVPDKAAQANIWEQQLRGVILQLGIPAPKVRERQQHNTTRPHQKCSPDERDVRATATTPALECRSNTNIHRGTWNNHGILQSHNNLSTHAQGGPVPMDIGAVNKGSKGSTTKEKERSLTKEKEKGKGNKGKGYGYVYNKGKGKIGQQMPYKGALNKGGYIGKDKGKPTGKGKGVPTQGCYRCGQPGHIARDCQVAVHNLNEAAANTNTYAGIGKMMQQPNCINNNNNNNNNHNNNNNSNNNNNTMMANGGMMTKHRSGHCHSNNWQFHSRAHRNNKFNNLTLQPCQSSSPTSNSQQLSKQQAPQKNWWLTVEQQHTFAHHGLFQHSQHMNYTLSKAQDLQRQQKKTSRSMATNGYTWLRTASNNQSSYPFTCVTYHNPFCQ